MPSVYMGPLGSTQQVLGAASASANYTVRVLAASGPVATGECVVVNTAVPGVLSFDLPLITPANLGGRVMVANLGGGQCEIVAAIGPGQAGMIVVGSAFSPTRMVDEGPLVLIAIELPIAGGFFWFAEAVPLFADPALIDVLTFDAPGPQSFFTPLDCNAIYAAWYSAGGGGGGAPAAGPGQSAAGGGGGGGGMLGVHRAVQPAEVIPYELGAGGAGGIGLGGAAGGDSWFDLPAQLVTGGAGGRAGALNAHVGPVSGGAPLGLFGGFVQGSGAPGAPGLASATSAIGGNGGGSPLQSGGEGATGVAASAQTGGAGAKWGGAGGGGAAMDAGPATGGTGADGALIVWCYR